MEKICERCNKTYEAKDRRGRWCPSCRPIIARETGHLRYYVGPRSLICVDCKRPFEARRSDAIRCPECRAKDAKRRSASFELRKKFPCPICGTLTARKASLCRVCANRERNKKYLLDKNPNWRGGRTLRKTGYVEIRIGSGNDKGTRVLEHRYVWEQAHGPIPDGWHIHHLNGIKDDNRLENLVAMSRSDHHRNHHEPWERRIRELESRIRELEA